MKAGNVSDRADARCADSHRLVPGAYHQSLSARRRRFKMTVNLTRIYTKLGDDGETHLGDMSRVSKLHPRVEAYGTVDELNATIGLALLAPGMPPRFGEWLARVQNDLLDVGADLSVPPVADDTLKGAGGEEPADGVHATRERLRVGPDYTAWLEDACDEVNATLEPLRSFVIPGGTPAAAQLHVCRTVCRRAERRAIAVGDESNAEVVRYLNRLSDLLFILSRAANNESADGERSEPLWAPGAHSAGGESPAS
jgi:cob(I)alamin adenosyltransferase